MKIFKILFLFCAAALLLLPLAFTTTQERVVSPLDNRMLATIPKTIQDWRSEGENVLKDRIGFREDMVLFYRRALYRLFGILEHPLYSAGSNGQLYLSDSVSLDAYQSIYEDADLERILAKLHTLHQYLQSRGKHLLYVQMPMKQSVYPEYMPSYIQKNTRPTLSLALENALKNTDIPHIFMADVLRRYKAIEPTYYQKFDPAHYNIIGAFAAHEAIAHKLRELYPDCPIPQRNDFRRTTKMVDLTPYFLKDTKEEIPVLARISQPFEHRKMKDIVFASYSVNKDAPVKQTLLIVGDSYMFDSRIYDKGLGAFDYYAPAFEKVYLIPTDSLQNVLALVNRFQPDVVLYEAAEFKLLIKDHFRWE